MTSTIREYLTDENPELIENLEKRYVILIHCTIDRNESSGMIWSHTDSAAFQCADEVEQHTDKLLEYCLKKLSEIRSSTPEWKNAALYVSADYNHCECLAASAETECLDDILYSRTSDRSVIYCDDDIISPTTIYRTIRVTASETTDTDWHTRTKHI